MVLESVQGFTVLGSIWGYRVHLGLLGSVWGFRVYWGFRILGSTLVLGFQGFGASGLWGLFRF